MTSLVGCGPVSLTVDTAGTTYTCEATSQGGTVTTSMTLCRDTVAPSVDCPVPLAPTEATSPAGADVTFAAATAQDAATSASLSYSVTSVTMTATDFAGNSASCTFLATVNTRPAVNLVANGCGCTSGASDASLAAIGLALLRLRRAVA